MFQHPPDSPREQVLLYFSMTGAETMVTAPIITVPVITKMGQTHILHCLHPEQYLPIPHLLPDMKCLQPFQIITGNAMILKIL